MALMEIIFALYLAALILVGFFTYKYNKTQEDYLLAGRKLGPWVTAFSERASGAMPPGSYQRVVRPANGAGDPHFG